MEVVPVSLHAYHYSLKLGEIDAPFDALIMAAIHRADSNNALRLRAAFPDIYRELMLRYHAPSGIIDGDRVRDADIVIRDIEEFSRQKL